SPPQRATRRNGALWGIADKLGVFRAYPPQRANWRNGTVWSNSQKNRAVLARQSSYGALWASFRHYLRLVRADFRVQSRDFPDAVWSLSFPSSAGFSINGFRSLSRPTPCSAPVQRRRNPPVRCGGGRRVRLIDTTSTDSAAAG